MKRWTPLGLLLLAILLVFFSFYGDDSYTGLVALRESTERQKLINSELRDLLRRQRREVTGLQNDPRTIEKAARNSLGMARPDELIFIFDDPSN